MREPAVLPEIVYEPIVNGDGERIGWAPSKQDRKRFDQGSRFTGTGTHVVRPTEPAETARALVEIVAQLDAWGIGDARLVEQLSELYEREPLIADRVAAGAVAGAQSGRLNDPTAFLASRLRPKR